MMRTWMSIILAVCILAHAGASTAAIPLRLGILPVLDTLPLQVAVTEKLFAEQGLDVEIVSFSSAMERDTAMQAGQLDGYFGDLLNTLLLIQAGAPMKVVTVSYRTTPGQPMFGMVLRPGLTLETVGEHPTVGYSRATIIDYLLDHMTRQGDIKEIAWKRTEVKKIPLRMQMLLSGQLDAAVLPEPLLTLTDSMGGEVAATDEKLDMPLTVLCLKDDFLDKKNAFLDAYKEAVQRVNDNPENYRKLMVETTRIPKPLVDSFHVYSFCKPRLPTETEVWRVQQWMLTRGMLRSMLDYEQVVD